MKKISYLFISCCLFYLNFNTLLAQQVRTVEIRKAASFEKNEAKYPGANILLSNDDLRVELYHEGGLIKANKALFYSKENSFEANGNVVFTQGDTLKMTSQFFEYDGKTKKAKAWGKVVLNRPDMTLKTDTLFWDRNSDLAYFITPGTIQNNSNTLKSKVGKYFMREDKYSFVTNVFLQGESFTINSTQLDYYTELNKSQFFGPTKIVGEDYTIFCKKGTYYTETEKGYFTKDAKINYNFKIIKGDSLYFENKRQYASANNNVEVIDTLNQSILKGEYSEIFKEKDSAIMTKKALAINIFEGDSLFIHADTLVGTGPSDNRILKGYYGVKIMKSDLSGKCDSIFFDEQKGIIELHKKPLSKNKKRLLSFKEQISKNPVIWYYDSQMSGDTIYIQSDLTTKKIDSLFIYGNAFLIDKDTIGNDTFNQVYGSTLEGNFKEGVMDILQVTKNVTVIYYLYSDEGELIGVDKTLCSKLDVEFDNQEIDNISFYKAPDGDVTPEDKIDPNLVKLEGFVWRIKERPISVDGLLENTIPKNIVE